MRITNKNNAFNLIRYATNEYYFALSIRTSTDRQNLIKNVLFVLWINMWISSKTIKKVMINSTDTYYFV